MPLLMAAARLPERLEWLREAIAEYIEEYGHQEWVLNDIAACGADQEAVRNGTPRLPTELMVAYVYDRIARHNPGFFGMVNVLEGTSIALATGRPASSRTSCNCRTRRSATSTPTAAWTWSTSSSSKLMNRLDNDDDKAAVVHTARWSTACTATCSAACRCPRRSDAMQPTDCRALLTGASGGIGQPWPNAWPARVPTCCWPGAAWSRWSRCSSAFRNRSSWSRPTSVHGPGGMRWSPRRRTSAGSTA
uniref:Uncharacterized protein n=1 Tax=Ectopseudomonas oleovorans TaxID=301 RepID=A0A653AYD5_ECTOL